MNEIQIFSNITKKDKNYLVQPSSALYNNAENNMGWSLGFLLLHYKDIVSNSIHVDLRDLFCNNHNQKYNNFFFKFIQSKKTKIILIVSLIMIDKRGYEKFEEVINFIHSFNRNILLIIDECYEGTAKHEFKPYESLLKEKFNDNFFIITGNKHMENKDSYIYYNIFKQYNFDYLINHPEHNFDFYFSYKKRNLKNIKLFVSFNRREREHRLAFAYFIQKIKFKHKYFLSLDTYKNYSHMENFNINEKEIEKIISPLYIDTKDFTVNKAKDIPFKIYCNSFFSHVNETTFSEDNLFLSEKIYKPIITMHPFTVMGNPYTLKTLKKEGFEVNFKGINNSYDLKKNHEERMLMIIEEIKKLDSLSKEDLLDFYYQNKDILIHNRNNFLNINKKNYKQQDRDTIIRKKIINKFNIL